MKNNVYNKHLNNTYNNYASLNLKKSSFLKIPYDYGINDPNYGLEDLKNYARFKMVKLGKIQGPSLLEYIKRKIV